MNEDRPPPPPHTAHLVLAVEEIRIKMVTNVTTPATPHWLVSELLYVPGFSSQPPKLNFCTPNSPTSTGTHRVYLKLPLTVFTYYLTTCASKVMQSPGALC